MKPSPSSPKEYIDSLIEERQKPMRKIRSLIRKSLPKGYKESIQYGMITYEVPPKPNGKKNVSLTLGSQKSYMALYFSNIYTSEKGQKKFREKYQESGHKLNMGKACLRFKHLDELNLVFITKLISGKLATPF